MIFMNLQTDSNLTKEEIYELFLFLQSLDDLKRSLVMVLLHVSPKELTTSQLTLLAGYSRSSKYIFKSKVLESLESENVIEINRPNQRLMLIRLRPDNKLLQKFSLLCQEQGHLLTEKLLQTLLEIS